MYALVNSRPRILDDPKALWESRGPDYSERPDDKGGRAAGITGAKTASDTLRSMAIGWRPRKKNQYRDLELSATIMGGIRALAGAGVYPWTGVRTTQFPELHFVKRKSREQVLDQLVALTQIVAKKAGHTPPPNAFYAAEYVRKKVFDARLQQPAWALRGLILTEEAAVNQATRSQAEGTTGKILMEVSKTGVGKIPVVGQIITGLGIFATASAARTKVEQARSEGQAKLFEQMYKQGMERRVAEAQLAAAQRQLSATISSAQALQRAKAGQAEEWGETVARAVVVGSTLLVAGAVGLTGVLIYRRVRRA